MMDIRNNTAPLIESIVRTQTTQALQQSITVVTSIAIIIVNCALLVFFNKHKHKVWTTYFFLTHLTLTDILIGVSLLVRVIIIKYVPEEFQWIRCRLPLTFVSSAMSAYCILVLSAQVWYDGATKGVH